MFYSPTEHQKGRNFTSIMKTTWLKKHKIAIIVLLLLFLERLLALHQLGVTYTLWSDDASYIKSGIHFMHTGMITMHDDWPSAQIMPGMTVLIGLFARLFGTGTVLWAVLKLFWITMGTLTAWWIYRSVCLFVPKWCGILAMLPLFRPDFVWMDNLILTETPYMFALAASVYFTLKIGKSPSWVYFFGLLAAYMGGFLLRANLLLYAPLALLYLLLAGYDKKLLRKYSAIFAAALICFILPWSVRNFIQFRAFIPLTYGAGNPILKGTYQGSGYPLDEELDYAANVDSVVAQVYRKYYQENGEVQPRYARYVSLARDNIMARYRQKIWVQCNPKSFLSSYLIAKPAHIIRSVFYWKEIFNIGGDLVIPLHKIVLVICAATAVISLMLKKLRLQVLFLSGTYFVNIYMYAMGLAFERYNAPLQCLLFILVGFGVGLGVQMVNCTNSPL